MSPADAPALDILALGAHPDDVEVHVGGILALATDRGLRAAILDLTSGDLGTRGTAETRRSEAQGPPGSWACPASCWTSRMAGSRKKNPSGCD